MFGNGEAAMEVQGHWGAAASKANSSSGKGLGDALGWFPFPTVDGGPGNATDAVGGTNGIAVGKNAPPEAIDFLHYLVSVDNQKKLGADNIAIPTTVGAESSVVDPQLQAVIEARARRSSSSCTWTRPPLRRWVPRSTTRPRH